MPPRNSWKLPGAFRDFRMDFLNSMDLPEYPVIFMDSRYFPESCPGIPGIHGGSAPGPKRKTGGGAPAPPSRPGPDPTTPAKPGGLIPSPRKGNGWRSSPPQKGKGCVSLFLAEREAMLFPVSADFIKMKNIFLKILLKQWFSKLF